MSAKDEDEEEDEGKEGMCGEESGTIEAKISANFLQVRSESYSSLNP